MPIKVNHPNPDAGPYDVIPARLIAQSLYATDRVVCIDASDKPYDINESDWLIQGMMYTTKDFFIHPISGDNSFTLYEVQTNNPAYEGYNINRFVPFPFMFN